MTDTKHSAVGRLHISGLTKYWPTNTGEMEPDCGISDDLYYKVKDVEAIAAAAPKAALVEALKNLLLLYEADDGCRSLPQYIAARAALAAAGVKP